ncbi:MAG: 4Fe-4S dicluster domain-containing protein [Mesorhizobium sp.]|uniref:4Fe-4S dicluster domain-containing protein n=1 Tax=Mesorhizobium sp. TaxID=1871066 RepID=UPI000FE67B07|nr:4Fe-4S dicluster domain-containing protein [Mesorhizobium sp.]RWB32233.1 MAG: 4Fe-4S dicluster domain-containing protein [Mesorhizobium sp.]RWB82944.1 MAG: 4Fe-4S dicluster domain-containing protein [Mesorhizobium sp.]RWF78514.1 MAG: 4Fe-4S dicluster domain-containing protein [Mesorhizobium sp.]TIS68545.1 MAG: 4Fe-4S dicluster domain-containing protein [Mesorhizobium sp.]TIW50294.1 MAG: 4Fe-4S dicluster domain-containing protein [Mesorhizobium sp.]
MTRLAMVLNLDRCIGCWACAIACKQENSIGEGLWWQKVATVGGASLDTSSGVFPDIQKHYQPRNCFHCADAPCIPVCPTGAIVKRPDGIVQILQELCVGCGKCEPACPFDAIEMNVVAPKLPEGLENGHGAAEVAPRVAGVVEKCSFCSHRVDAGRDPACVAACPTQVITFGDVDDPNSQVAAARNSPGAFRLGEETGADPSVWFLPATHGALQRRSGKPSGEKLKRLSRELG